MSAFYTHKVRMLLIISTNFIPFCISMHHKNAPVTRTPSGDNCIWHLRCQLKHSLNQLWKITMFYSELPHSPTVNFLWFSRQLLVISESCIQTFLTCQLSSNIPVWYPDNLNDICRGNLSPFFYRPDALPVAQPTVSKHWREDICRGNSNSKREVSNNSMQLQI